MSLRSSRMYTSPIPKMPPGLIDLMEGLTKDVLKNNPANIYEFCSQHMQKLIEIRDRKAQKKDLTVSEKILIAQQKVHQRAELRQKKYDKDMELLKTNENAATRNKKDTNLESELLSDVISFDDGPENKVKQIEISPKDLLIKDEKSQNFNGQANIFENMAIKPGNEKTFDQNATDFLLLNQSDDKRVLTDEKNSSQILSITEIENIAINTQEAVNNKKEMDTKNEVNTLYSSTIKESNDKICSSESDKELETNKLEEYSVLNNDRQIQADKVFVSNEGVNLDEIELKETNVDSPEKVIEAVAENESTILEASDQDFSVSSVETPEKSAVDELKNSFENNMDLEKAAITIQKVFRAFLFKSKTLSVDDVDFNFLIENRERTDKEEVNDTTTENIIKERRSLGINRMDTVLQTVNEEKSLSLSTEDSSTLSSAATIIQAHVRGFLVRNKMHFNQTNSTVSVIDSEIQSPTSLDGNQNDHKHKTILNIHIVPEGSNFISRDESLITSVDLSLDGSPHFSTNLHPLGYDKSERRKQLKREDAVQSISPPSNNSGKLSEEVDSIKEITHNDSNNETVFVKIENLSDAGDGSEGNIATNDQELHNSSDTLKKIREATSDEADVVTAFSTDGLNSPNKQTSISKLMHSGEFHDIVLPTTVSRNNTSVVRGE